MKSPVKSPGGSVSYGNRRHWLMKVRQRAHHPVQSIFRRAWLKKWKFYVGVSEALALEHVAQHPSLSESALLNRTPE